jgi:hypothetical protein
VEIWLEKDALSGVVNQVTDEYDVGLHVARGFASLSFLAESAEDIREIDKPTYIYHLGDHDPSGRNAGEKIEQTLREMAPDADITFERLAVTEEQIAIHDLPLRPTKRSDPRAKKFEAEFGLGSVELDPSTPTCCAASCARRSSATWTAPRSRCSRSPRRTSASSWRCSPTAAGDVMGGLHRVTVAVDPTCCGPLP